MNFSNTKFLAQNFGRKFFEIFQFVLHFLTRIFKFFKNLRNNRLCRVNPYPDDFVPDPTRTRGPLDPTRPRVGSGRVGSRVNPISG